jgi:hypothetical protein
MKTPRCLFIGTNLAISANARRTGTWGVYCFFVLLYNLLVRVFVSICFLLLLILSKVFVV